MALIGHQSVGWTDGSATPSTSITVPTGATHVLFLATWWMNAMSSISLTDGTLEDSFDFAEAGAFAGYSRGAVRLWSVSSIGSKTLSATFAAGPSDGPCAFVVYLDEAPTLPDADYAGDSGSDVTQAVTLTGLQVDDLVFAIDTRDDSTTAPGNESGWTSLDTAAHNLESGRLRYIAAAGSSVTATSQPTVSWAHVIAAAVRFTPPPGPPIITPVFGDFAGNNGGTVTLHGDALPNGGTGLSYQWQEDTGSGWTNVGTDSPTYDVTSIGSGMIGYQWRVQATNSEGTTDSAAATLTAVISSKPELAAMSELAFAEHDPDNNTGVVGTANITEAPDTVAATGTIAIAAAASITEAADTLSATASLAVQGTATITEAADTVSGTTAVAVQAAAGVTEDPDTLTATGTIGLAGVTATLAVTESPDTLGATGAVLLAAAGSLSEAPDTINAAASVAVQATAAITESADTLSASAQVAADGVTATANITDAPDTLSATAEVSGTPAPQPEILPFAGDDDYYHEIVRERRARRARTIQQNNTLILAIAELAAEGAIA